MRQWADQVCCDRLHYGAIDVSVLRRLPVVIVNSGIIDEYVEVSISLLHLGCGVLDAGRVGNIQEKRFDVAGLCELPCCRSRLCSVSRCEEHDKTSARQLTAHFESNAAVCARD